jgi:hypothetical protein
MITFDNLFFRVIDLLNYAIFSFILYYITLLL